MAVDLNNLIDYLKAEVNSPGIESFPDATDDDWLIRLQSSFWDVVLQGAMSGYTVDDNGVVTPISGTTDLSRDVQQFIVFNAGVDIIRNKIREMGSLFRAVAGPVEYETQNSAQVMKAILDELTRKRNIVLERLSDLGQVGTGYYDMLITRDDSLSWGDSWWAKY